jgi:sugar phosphate isomerase/epimerase
MPKLSLSQLGFPHTTLQEDITIAKDLGLDGIGLIGGKTDDVDREAIQQQLQAANLQAAVCAPKLFSILPQPNVARFPGPQNVTDRVDEIAAGIKRLAVFEPDVICCVTGPAGDRVEDDARAIVAESLRELGRVAAQTGARIGLEPMRADVRADWTIISSLKETLDLLDEVGDDHVGILFDIWHMWDSADVHRDLFAAIERVVGVQISDYRMPTRGPRDRLIAGDGVAGVAGFLKTFRENGYRGWYDMEVFSDDGRFGYAYPDSLWKLPPREYAQRQVDGFYRCWNG